MNLLKPFMNARIWGRGASAINPGLVLATIVVFIVLCFASPYFLTTNNLLNVAKALVIVGIAAAGETVVIIAGGFDLSIGSTMAAAGMLAAYLLDIGSGVGPAFSAGDLSGHLHRGREWHSDRLFPDQSPDHHPCNAGDHPRVGLCHL